MRLARRLGAQTARGLFVAARHVHGRLAGLVFDLTYPALVWYMRRGGGAPLKRALIPALILPAVPTHRAREFVATTYFGSRMMGTTGDVIPLAVHLFGVLEENLSYWCDRCLAPGDLVVDVGAHVGYFSLLASRLVGASGEVVAIEASPTTFVRLQGNLALNAHAANVRPVCAVAGDIPGVRAVFRGPAHSTGLTSVRARSQIGNRFEADVAQAPLATLLSPDEIARVRLIKIDVEGAEFEVLEGLTAVIEDLPARCEIVVETSEDWQYRGRQASVQDLIAWFDARGFHAYLLPKDFVVDRARARAPERVRAPLGAGYYDFVFSHRDEERL
jgi:FkbM family methyltransferase